MNKLCPLLNKPCIEHDCKFYGHLLGQNPQSGKQQDEFDCVISFIPILIIEAAAQMRQAGAAIESFRNEMRKINDENKPHLLANTDHILRNLGVEK